MSAIDRYKHQLLGFIKCESDYDIMNNNSTRKVAIYKLEQNIPQDEKDFDGEINDILVGGGSGEAPALRISYPNAFKFFTQTDFDDFNEYAQLFKAFWSANQSFKLCYGYLKSGWQLNEKIEFWLAEEVIKLLSKHIPGYSNFTFRELACKLEFETFKK